MSIVHPCFPCSLTSIIKAYENSIGKLDLLSSGDKAMGFPSSSNTIYDDDTFWWLWEIHKKSISRIYGKSSRWINFANENFCLLPKFCIASHIKILKVCWNSSCPFILPKEFPILRNQQTIFRTIRLFFRQIRSLGTGRVLLNFWVVQKQSDFVYFLSI